MIRLICIDVDGTLIGSSGDVHSDVWNAAAKARARGVRLALCSGRPGFGRTRDYAAKLDATGWHVFQNGASVLSLGDGGSRSTPLAKSLVDVLVARANEMNRCLELYTDTTYVVERATDAAKAHAALLGVPYAPRSFDSFFAEGANIVRAQWLLAPEEEAQERAERSRFPELEVSASTSPMMPGTLFVNLTMAGTHKGSAVQAVAEAYGFPLSDVMFVGDSANDVPAMERVGHPVAMGNAEDEVVRVARHRVGHVDALGLVQAFELAERS